MPVQLFVDPISSTSRAIVVFTRLFQLPVDVRWISIKRGEHRTPELARANPLGKVPFLLDDGICVPEACSILTYLAQSFHLQIPDSWYPLELRAKTQVDAGLHWQQRTLRLNTDKLLSERVVRAARITPGSPIPAPVEASDAQRGLQEALCQLEYVWLANAQGMQHRHKREAGQPGPMHHAPPRPGSPTLHALLPDQRRQLQGQGPGACSPPPAAPEQGRGSGAGSVDGRGSADGHSNGDASEVPVLPVRLAYGSDGRPAAAQGVGLALPNGDGQQQEESVGACGAEDTAPRVDQACPNPLLLVGKDKDGAVPLHGAAGGLQDGRYSPSAGDPASAVALKPDQGALEGSGSSPDRGKDSWEAKRGKAPGVDQGAAGPAAAVAGGAPASEAEGGVQAPGAAPLALGQGAAAMQHQHQHQQQGPLERLPSGPAPGSAPEPGTAAAPSAAAPSAAAPSAAAPATSGASQPAPGGGGGGAVPTGPAAAPRGGAGPAEGQEGGVTVFTFMGGGTSPCLSDLLCACIVEQLRLLDSVQEKPDWADVLMPFPRVRAWMASVEAVCRPHFTDVHANLRLSVARAHQAVMQQREAAAAAAPAGALPPGVAGVTPFPAVGVRPPAALLKAPSSSNLVGGVVAPQRGMYPLPLPLDASAALLTAAGAGPGGMMAMPGGVSPRTTTGVPVPGPVAGVGGVSGLRPPGLPPHGVVGGPGSGGGGGGSGGPTGGKPTFTPSFPALPQPPNSGQTPADALKAIFNGQPPAVAAAAAGGVKPGGTGIRQVPARVPGVLASVPRSGSSPSMAPMAPGQQIFPRSALGGPAAVVKGPGGIN